MDKCLKAVRSINQHVSIALIKGSMDIRHPTARPASLLVLHGGHPLTIATTNKVRRPALASGEPHSKMIALIAYRR
jgi:hypothetical protein